MSPPPEPPPALEGSAGADALRQGCAPALEELAAAEGALVRAKTATAFIELLSELRRDVARDRVEAVGQLRRSGLSLAAIARELGISTNAVVQIDRERKGLPRR